MSSSWRSQECQLSWRERAFQGLCPPKRDGDHGQSRELLVQPRPIPVHPWGPALSTPSSRLPSPAAESEDSALMARESSTKPCTRIHLGPTCRDEALPWAHSATSCSSQAGHHCPVVLSEPFPLRLGCSQDWISGFSGPSDCSTPGSCDRSMRNSQDVVILGCGAKTIRVLQQCPQGSDSFSSQF